MPGGVAKKQRRNVSFNEEVDIINPEDIDPTIGRFRNLVKSTIVPNANSAPRKLKLQTADDSKFNFLSENTKTTLFTILLNRQKVFSSLYYTKPQKSPFYIKLADPVNFVALYSFS